MPLSLLSQAEDPTRRAKCTFHPLHSFFPREGIISPFFGDAPRDTVTLQSRRYQLSSMASPPLHLCDWESLFSSCIDPEPKESEAFETESSRASRNERTVNLSAKRNLRDLNANSEVMKIKSVKKTIALEP